MKYAIVDIGKNMASYCSVIEAELKKNGIHYVIYLTDQDNLMCVEFITEDDFLDHFKNTNNGRKA
jgi:hypothetical protein